MKLLLAALLSSVALSAFAAPSIIGNYKSNKLISAWSITKEECKNEKGRWDSLESYCLIKVEDTASIRKAGKNYRLHVTTTGANYHSCEFDGPAVLTKPDTLVSSIKTEVYNFDSGRPEKAVCKVTANFTKKGMQISTNLKCQGFCGANSWLDVTGMKKAN